MHANAIRCNVEEPLHCIATIDDDQSTRTKPLLKYLVKHLNTMFIVYDTPCLINASPLAPISQIVRRIESFWIVWRIFSGVDFVLISETFCFGNISSRKHFDCRWNVWIVSFSVRGVGKSITYLSMRSAFVSAIRFLEMRCILCCIKCYK